MPKAADVGETRLVLCLVENDQRTTIEQPFEGQGFPPPQPVFPATAARCRGPGATVGEDPETTPLYQVVQHHLESCLALKRAGEAWEDTVPVFVEHDFRKYLDCGILARALVVTDARAAVTT